jgi:hypothetical protein
LGESPSAQAQVESRRAHSRAPSERRALGVWGLLKYTYDLAGNLTEVRIDPASGPTKTLDYIIDASGRRVGKKLNGAFSKQYVWSNALRIEAELDTSGNIKSRFIYSRSPNSPELIVRKTTGQPDRVYRVISDQLGSPVFVVNIGQPTDVWLDATYDAWGNDQTYTCTHRTPLLEGLTSRAQKTPLGREVFRSFQTLIAATVETLTSLRSMTPGTRLAPGTLMWTRTETRTMASTWHFPGISSRFKAGSRETLTKTGGR